MYKTIRHGENSLQYTILPQNDDFRIEGKLSSAGSNCTSGKTRKSKAKRPRRRSFFAYLGLIFVCTVIVGAILIPFLVSAECLPNPTEWFLKTKAALTKGNVDSKPNGEHAIGNGAAGSISGNGINVGKIIKIINKDGTAKAVFSSNQTHELVNNATATTTNNATSTKQESYLKQNSSNISNLNQPPPIGENEVKIPTAPDDKIQDIEMVLKQTQTETDTQQQQAHALPQSVSNVEIDTQKQPIALAEGSNNNNNNFVTEIRFDSMQQDIHAGGDVPAVAQTPPHVSAAIVPTIVVTTTSVVRNTAVPNKINGIFSQTLPIARPTSAQSSANAVYSPRLPASNIGIVSQPAAAASLPTIMTRIIQVPLLKSAAKKPIMPPVLAKTNSQYNVVGGNTNIDNTVPVPAIDTPSQLSASSEVAASSSLSTSSSEKSTTKLIQGAATNSNWIHAHWPYIDPSTYFQWTGYKAEDSVLLPALLGFALIGMILIITVCLVARNKRTIVSSVRKRNRNDIEETGAEDNATLLTTTNLSDED